MDGNKRFVTQLSRDDLREIAAATSPTPGLLIRIDKSQGDLKISIDENAFKIAVFAFMRNLGACYPISPTVETITNTPLTLQ